jgi:hypothetical protein
MFVYALCVEHEQVPMVLEQVIVRCACGTAMRNIFYIYVCCVRRCHTQVQCIHAMCKCLLVVKQ